MTRANSPISAKARSPISGKCRATICAAVSRAFREIAPGLELWALFAANGQPILLSDARERALAGALENDLTPVAIH